ncbi:MAG: trigger factor [Ruminococcaceae bacterium]|nr:trigger factor [Oscillospiraceae bacterium]
MALKSSTLKETNKYELEVTVDAETFEKAVQKSYNKNKGQVRLQGFRPGKAPRQMIEKMYGKDVFYPDAIEFCYPDALDAAIKEAGLKVVGVESVEEVSADSNGFEFKAIVIVEPELEIEGYKGLEIKSKGVRVTEKMIGEEIDKIRDRNSRMVTVEDRPAADGDTAVIDFEGFLGEVAFEGGKAENYNLALGSGSFIPGFEEQIVGHNAGEEFTITVKFPEDYQAEELKGQDAQFKIKLHEIKAKELPELDDEFVKDVSDKETVDEYKAEIKETITKRLKEERENDINTQITDKLIELVQGDIPEVMFDNEVNSMVRDFDARLRSQGMEMNMYLGYMGMDIDALKNMYRKDAEKRVKLRLALKKIAKLENIVVTDEDVEAEFARLAETYKVEVDHVKTIVDAEDQRDDIAVQRAMDIVKKEAAVK